MSKRTNSKPRNNKILLVSLVGFFLLTGIAYSLITGTGPLVRLFGATPSVNETKTLCTRKLDGRKECTTWEVNTQNGLKTTTTNTAIISGSNTMAPKVEYKFETKKVAPVDKNGIQTGNSTTIEVRKNVKDNGDDEVLSTVTTIQKPPAKKADGTISGPGEVVQEIRTGDITLGVAGYKATDKDKYDKCIESGKVWVDNKCVDKNADTRTPEQKCTQNLNGSPTGNTWLNGLCNMKITSPGQKATPAGSSSLPNATSGVNCDVGMCSTSGSPVCFGTYASTGQYMEGTTDYACKLCGDTGNGVGFTGLTSCKTLLSSGAPVVIGTSANPVGFGLPAGSQTGSCLSKRGAEWVLTGVGQPGEGPNEGMVCSPSGQWVKTLPKISEPIAKPKTEKDDAQTRGNCVAGLTTRNGVEVWLNCSDSGEIAGYTYCFRGEGKFDENGQCLKPEDSPSLSTGIDLDLAGTGFQLGLNQDGNIVAHMFTDPKAFIGGVSGCLASAGRAALTNPSGIIGGCAAGAVSGSGLASNSSLDLTVANVDIQDISTGANFGVGLTPAGLPIAAGAATGATGNFITQNVVTPAYKVIKETPDSGITDNVVGTIAGVGGAFAALPVCTGFGFAVWVPLTWPGIAACEAAAFGLSSATAAKVTDIVIDQFSQE